MSEEHRIERVLVCARSTLVPRLLAHYAEEGIEAVVGFSEADVEAPWVEEADFAAYLNGRTAEESYLHAERVVSAAMDAGCDAIHPGASSIAESVELYHLANNANVAVITGDPMVIARAADRSFQRGIAESRGARLLPASPPLGSDDDGLEAAMPLGLPLDLCTAHGMRLARVHDLSALPTAMAAQRERAKQLAGTSDLVLRPPRPTSATPRTTLVVAERVGRVEVTANERALVYVDGEVRGYTPVVLSEAAGERSIRVVIPGQTSTAEERSIRFDPSTDEHIQIQF